MFLVKYLNFRRIDDGEWHSFHTERTKQWGKVIFDGTIIIIVVIIIIIIIIINIIILIIIIINIIILIIIISSSSKIAIITIIIIIIIIIIVTTFLISIIIIIIIKVTLDGAASDFTIPGEASLLRLSNKLYLGGLPPGEDDLPSLVKTTFPL